MALADILKESVISRFSAKARALSEAPQDSRMRSRRFTDRLQQVTGRRQGFRCHPWRCSGHPLAELLGKRDNDALRPADVG